MSEQAQHLNEPAVERLPPWNDLSNEQRQAICNEGDCWASDEGLLGRVAAMGIYNKIRDTVSIAPTPLLAALKSPRPGECGAASADLTVDQIDEAISGLIVRGHHGAAAGVNLARVAGRALKMLQTVVGPKAALIAAENLLSNVKTGAIQ